MSMGMSYNEYWYGEPGMAGDYRRAYNLMRQRKSDEMWLMGLYVYDALSVAISNAFSKKGTRPKKYLEEPLRITPLTKEEREIKAEQERQKTIAYFDNLAKKWAKKQNLEN